MKAKRRVLSLLLLLVCLAAALSVTAIAIAANEGRKNAMNQEDATVALRADEYLESCRRGETQKYADDGAIGIPVEVTVYYDLARFGKAKAGYMTRGATPIILYVVNAGFEKIGTDSDTSILRSMLDRGYAVAVFDYKNNPKAVSPALDSSAQVNRTKLMAGNYLTDAAAFESGSYQDCYVVPAGDNILLNDVYFELDKHGTDGTLETIVNVWNDDFRMYKQDTVVKWVHEDGSRKATQNGHDGSSPVWYSDAQGRTVDQQNGRYIRVKHTKAEVITDCVNADGSPIDLNLYFHAIYPTHPENPVPVMAYFSSSGYLTLPTAEDRPHFNGFLFGGYAGVIYDYAWVPMGRNDHYGYFDGSSGIARSVTGDNQSYATYTFNLPQVSTAAMRYIRYLALTDPDTYDFNIEKVGVYGISKASFIQHLCQRSLSEDLLSTADGLTEEQIAEAVNEMVNAMPQQLILSGHHGETRYDNGKTETYTKDGITIDGGERQPWAVYGGREIASGVQACYGSCGGFFDNFASDMGPQFLTSNLQDTYNTEYGNQNHLINLCRTMNIPALWYEADIAHTFAAGPDDNYGVDTYAAFFYFCDYYLKDAPVRVTYTDPIHLAAIPADRDILIKFIGEVGREEIGKITLTDPDGNPVSGIWTAQYGDTEWTFHPSGMQGGTLYTLTVPGSLVGKNGKAIAEPYTATFLTDPETTAQIALGGESVTVTEEGSLISFPAPAVSKDEPEHAYLRFSVTNPAVNRLAVYASDESGAAGEQIGSLQISGEGAYEIDVTAAVYGKAPGETAYLLLKNENEGKNALTYQELFISGSGGFSVGSYTSATVRAVVDDTTCLSLAVKQNFGKFDKLAPTYHYYASESALSSTKILNDGGNVTPADLGRTFLITVRVYDTVDRSIRLTLNSETNKTTQLLDYQKVYEVFHTKAGEWCEFTVPYTVYEAEYGAASRQKKFTMIIGATGDTEMPIYVDSVRVYEVFTDTEIGGASIALREEGVYPYQPAKDDLPFAVGDALYEDLASAAAAATGGREILLRRDTVISGKDSLSIAGGAVTLDLSGYRLTAATTSPLFAFGAGNGSLTIQNGTLILADSPLFGFGATDGGKISILLDGLDLKIAEHSVAQSVFCATESGNADVDLTLYGSVMKIRRRSLPDRRVTLFATGTGKLAVHYTLEGTDLYLDSLHELNFCDGAIAYREHWSGQGGVFVSSSEKNAPSASFKKDGAYYVLRGEPTEPGYTAYRIEPAAESTPYGAIPDSYLDPDAYPFILFSGEAVIGTAGNYASVSQKARVFTETHPGAEIAVVMRKDHVVSSGTDKLDKLNGKLILDLSGHTLTRGTTIFEGMVESGYTGNFETSLTVRNGVILADRGMPLALEGLSEKDKVYHFAFENVTFAMTSSYPSGYPIFRSWGHKATGVTNADFTFTDCSFDFAGLTEGSAAPTGSVTLFDVSDNGLNADITLRGGVLSATASTVGRISWYSLSASGDRVVFAPNESGERFRLSLPTGAQTPKITLPAEEGASTFVKIGEEGGRAVYELGEPVVQREIETPYGVIPAASSTASAAIFADGKFLVSAESWKEISVALRDRLNAHPGESLDVLFLADMTTNGLSASERLSYLRGSVNFDLNGHTLVAGSTLLECGVADAYYSGETYPTAAVFRNGKLLIGAGYLFASESRSSADKSISLTFENITFGVDRDGYNTARNKLFFAYNDQSQWEGRDEIAMTFRDCTFDLRGIRNTFTVFSFPNTPSGVAAKIVLEGGSVLSDSPDNITWQQLDGNDSLTLCKNADGEYPILRQPAGSDPVLLTARGEDGGILFYSEKQSADGETTYEAVPATDEGIPTPYGAIPFEQAGAVFALFTDGAFLSSQETWAKAVNAARTYLASHPGETVAVLMRKNHTNTSGTDPLGRITGSLVVDLGGHTLVRGGGQSLMEAGTKGATEGECAVAANITVRNGRILAMNKAGTNSGHIMTYQSFVNFDKEINVTFDSVTFAISADLTNDGLYSLITRCWGASGGATGVITSDLTFRDCTFDFSGSEGTKTIASTRLVSTSGGKASQNIAITVEGGEYLGRPDGVTLFDIDSTDSLTFTKNADGEYLLFKLSFGDPQISSAVTEEGTLVYTRIGTELLHGEKCTVYALRAPDPEGLDTAYGKVPAEDAGKPFAVFGKDGFLGAAASWKELNGVLKAELDARPGESLTVLLLRDHAAGGVNESERLSYMNGEILFDLNGFSLVTTSTLIECGVSGKYYTEEFATKATFKNGSLLLGSGNLFAAECRAAVDKRIELFFENITFGIDRTYTYDDRHSKLFFAWNDNGSTASRDDLRLTFTDCTFDLRAIPDPYTLFAFADTQSGVAAEIRIAGGRFLIAEGGAFTLFTGDENDRLTFGRSDFGYPTANLLPTAEDMTAENGETVYFAKVGDGYAMVELAFGEWEEKTPAGCTEAGEEIRANLNDPGRTESREIPAKGHAFVHYDEKLPTCTEAGFAEYDRCERCGESTYRQIPALGHDYIAAVTPPTCTEGGYTTYSCSRCDDVYTADETPPLGHDYMAEFILPTCTEGGFTRYTCSRCDDSYVANETAPLGHSFGQWQTMREATADEPGLEVRTCRRCGETESREIAFVPVEFFAAYESEIAGAATLAERSAAIDRAVGAYLALTDAERRRAGEDYAKLLSAMEAYNAEANAVNEKADTAAEDVVRALLTASGALTAAAALTFLLRRKFI